MHIICIHSVVRESKPDPLQFILFSKSTLSIDEKRLNTLRVNVPIPFTSPHYALNTVDTIPVAILIQTQVIRRAV